MTPDKIVDKIIARRTRWIEIGEQAFQLERPTAVQVADLHVRNDSAVTRNVALVLHALRAWRNVRFCDVLPEDLPELTEPCPYSDDIARLYLGDHIDIFNALLDAVSAMLEDHRAQQDARKKISLASSNSESASASSSANAES